jgi:cytochrome c-type biogenesis protein CcmH
MRPVRQVLATAAVVTALMAAGVGLWQAGHERPRTLEQRTETVATQLRCPTCQAQSVAMSRSEIAGAMRAEIRAQLVAGRTPEQIRDWFAARYGPAVLLEPPQTGVGLVLWFIPAALLGVGAVLTAVVVRRRVPARPTSGSPGSARPGRIPAPARLVVPVAAFTLVTAGVATWLIGHPAGSFGTARPAAAGAESSPEVARHERAVADRPTNPDTWIALGAALEAERAYGQSAQAYRIAAELRPRDVRTEVRLGLVLLQAGEPAEAESVARRILADHPAHPEGTLVLGLAQRARDRPTARATLRRFLDLAPAHPAAGQVRRLLSDS